MFSNQYFTVKVLIGGIPVPEYVKAGQNFVESNLNTPLTYKDELVEDVDGCAEKQESPVTPYQIKITAHSSGYHPHYFRVMVDGVKVKGISMEAGQSRVIKGFRDGTVIRELLFSMPRFAKDETDRLAPERQSSIGKIVVECWDATLRSRKCVVRQKKLDFKQANKKDSTVVTKGEYLMATSRAGHEVARRSLMRDVDYWKLNTLLDRVTIHYHMAHTLRNMGITLQPFTLRHRHSRSHGGLLPKVEVKSEPQGVLCGCSRKKRRTQPPPRDRNSHEVAAALLALSGPDRVSNPNAVSSSGAQGTSTQSSSGQHENSSPTHSSGIPSTSPEESQDRENAEEDMEEDLEEDDLEILEVRSGNQNTKEPALIDLTGDSDDETPSVSSSEKVHFNVKNEVKAETDISDCAESVDKSVASVSAGNDSALEKQQHQPVTNMKAVSSQDSGLGDELPCSIPTDKRPSAPVKDNSASADKVASDQTISLGCSSEETTKVQTSESTNSQAGGQDNTLESTNSVSQTTHEEVISFKGDSSLTNFSDKNSVDSSDKNSVDQIKDMSGISDSAKPADKTPSAPVISDDQNDMDHDRSSQDSCVF